MSCEFAHDDGAYVLGALPPAERLDFERHLTDCKDCTRAVRELAGLPGLLGRVDASVLEDLPEDELPVPDTLLPALSSEVRRAGRRRTYTTAALAAAAVVLAVTVPVVVSQVTDGDGPQAIPGPTATATPSTAPAPPQAMRPVGDVPVRASLTLENVTWGTRLGLTCTYDPEWVEYNLPPTPTYALFVRTRDGRSEQVGTWRSMGGRTMRLQAATASSRDDIRSVQVRTLDGRVLLQLTA